MTETDPQQAARDRLFALIASIPGSGGVDWCGKARALLNEIAAAPAAAPSVPVDRAALRDRIAAVIHDDLTSHKGRRDLGLLGIVPRLAAAVLAVIPAPAGRAAEWRAAADHLETLDPIEAALAGQHAWREAAETLRRMADEAQQPAVVTTVEKAAARGMTDTEYRAASHRAAVEAVRAAAKGMYAEVGLRVMDALSEAQQPETQAGCGCPNETAVEHQFGTADCTCIPFVREGGTARYCQPGDTVDQISGWERGGDCPHHRPPADEAQQADTAGEQQ